MNEKIITLTGPTQLMSTLDFFAILMMESLSLTSAQIIPTSFASKSENKKYYYKQVKCEL